jgi:CHAT domain-containing protein
VSFGYSARGLVKSHGATRAWADGASLVIDNPRPLPPLYDPLNLSGFEAAEVIRHVPGVVLSGREAKTQAVCDALPSPVLVHFSCHGDADPRIAYSGALFLADSMSLTFEQLRQMTEISARLVVLSACRSGSAALGVEQMLSLPAAFLAAGADAVLGTFWHTDEMASLLLFRRFYDLCIGEGASPGVALGEAQAWLMTSTAAVLRAAAPAAALALAAGGELREAAEEALPYSHPWYWAAFFLAGA